MSVPLERNLQVLHESGAVQLSAFLRPHRGLLVVTVATTEDVAPFCFLVRGGERRLRVQSCLRPSAFAEPEPLGPLAVIHVHPGARAGAVVTDLAFLPRLDAQLSAQAHCVSHFGMYNVRAVTSGRPLAGFQVLIISGPASSLAPLDQEATALAKWHSTDPDKRGILLLSGPMRQSWGGFAEPVGVNFAGRQPARDVREVELVVPIPRFPTRFAGRRLHDFVRRPLGGNRPSDRVDGCGPVLRDREAHRVG